MRWNSWLSVGLAVVAMACTSQAQQAPFEVVAAFPALPRFEQPVDLQAPPNGSNRLFVVEQPGRIRAFDNDAGAAAAPVFLDLTGRVLFGGEQGLLGLAFHPRYAENGYFYVNYTAGNPRRTVIARYRADPADPARAEVASEQVLLEVAQPFSNHNGGQLAFGPDGYLYAALGDGGSGGDPQGHGQNRATLLGAILRLDVDRAEGGRAYAIPPDNPFVGALCGPAGCREEIYAYGLRNPWRMSFDPPTGVLWAGDVGQGSYEEIDRIERGANYGWNRMEGFHCFPIGSSCDQAGLTLPVFEYDHSRGDRSITGGYVYRGPGVPELTGRYVYADFVSGRIWALRTDTAPVQNALLADTDLSIASFGTDAVGELYVLAFDGRLYRLRPTVNVGVEGRGALPEAPALEGAFPNPFGTSTRLAFGLERAQAVEVAVFDVLGRRVRTLLRQSLAAGRHTAAWDGRDEAGTPVPAGLYVARLAADGRAVAAVRLVRR